MQRNIYWLCCALRLLLLCCALICTSTAEQSATRRHAKRQHGNPHQRPHGPKKYCDPSFSNQTAGAITQRCGSGFYREWTGPLRGQCVPCSCNGLSNECDSHTGNCVNCQFNTDGNRCERCKEGYYGDAAQRTCQACPCPLTWNNFALACLDIGSGVVECLCKPGYHGARCERCASSYYGNPMIYGGSCQPCNCNDGTASICDSLTGECIIPGDAGSGDHCYECDGCTDAFLNDLEKMDDELYRLKLQLQNISRGAGSLSMLSKLEANISETKILVGRYSTAVNSLDPKIEQLGADVDVVKEDLSQLMLKIQKALSDSHKVLESVNGTKTRAEDLLSEVEALLTTIQNLVKQLSEVKPGDSTSVSQDQVSEMLEEARRMVQEMRERGCSAQRQMAIDEQDEAHKLLDLIRNSISDPLDSIQPVVNQVAGSLMNSSSSLRDVARLLSEAEDTVGRAVGLNLRSNAILRDLLKLRAQLEEEQGALRPVIQMIRDQLMNITDLWLMLKDSRQELERLMAQLDGAQSDLIKKLNRISQALGKVDIVIKAEEHAEELSKLARDLQILLHNVTNSSGLAGVAMGSGDENSIINAIEKAELAANQSKVAADLALKDVEQGGLVNRAQGLKEEASQLLTEAKETENHLKTLSLKIDSNKKSIRKQNKKGELLKKDILTISDDLKKIKRDDTEALLDSAKAAASAANKTANEASDRLRTISQEVDKRRFTNASSNLNDILKDAEQALRNFNMALPSLRSNLTQVEELSQKTPPSANMTESIRKIKDVIAETRHFVSRLSSATTFNGKGHMELRPPRDLEDVKAFTAFDLLLNRHQNSPSKADRSRKRRQDANKEDNLFVLYLGNKDPSGDYVGMAVRGNVLVCVYKLGGFVHEVKTSQITTTTNVNSTALDRVVFHRVYQDAEVNITQNFTSSNPIIHSPKRNLPKTMTGVLNLDPDSVVFYVGGYPEDFTPPAALRYPRYRGAIKLSFVNDNPVCLFNYKHAANLGQQPYVKVPQSEVSDYYDGTGYRMALTSNPQKKKRRLFRFHTNSRETNALLFYIGNEDSYFCVFMERGHLVLQGRQAGQELKAQSGEKVSLFDMQFTIAMDDKFIVNYKAKQISTNHTKAEYSSYYIGGLPAHLRERDNIMAPPLRGCVDHLSADGVFVEYNRTIGVSVGCPLSLLGVREATYNSVVSVNSLGVWDTVPVTVSLGFRSTETHGALLRSTYQDSTSFHDFQLSLVDGYVVFSCDMDTLNSHKMYNDGSWHYLSAARSPTGLEMSIDNVNVGQAQTHHTEPLQLSLAEEKFKGCIANLYSRRLDSGFLPADLSSLSLMGDVVLGACRLSPPPQAMLLPAPLLQSDTRRHRKIHAQTGSTSQQCRQRLTHYGGYRLSEPHSWLSYSVPPEELNYRPHFSLEVRTRSSKGLLLYIAGKGEISLLALFMAGGKIKLSLGQNRIIHHKKKSNDGNWHRVVFSVEKNTFHLLVDGVRVTDGHLSNDAGSYLDLQNPVYLGGVPLRKLSKGHLIPKESVIGCVRDFKLNEVLVGEPVAHRGASSCFDGLSEAGTYFGGDGSHIVLDKYFTVGSHFDLAFELRPQHLTGLLFHTRSTKTSFDVFLVENKVGVKVNDGNGVVSISVTPHQSLCDGKFHAVTVSKQKEAVKVTVDSVSEQKLGPSPSTSSSATLDSLYIGGTTKRSRAPVSSSFIGCLRKVRLNGRPVAFKAASSVVGTVNISKCPAA